MSALRIAIVGAGPAGFYVAEHLLKQDAHAVEVDLLDRLPTPYGLVRAGVAPDHPKIKAVIRLYEKTAALPGFRFFGGVEVGRDVTVADLSEHYHAVVCAYGAAIDRRLGIPGEQLPGSHTASEFVGWYNAHPDFSEREFELPRRVVVVGNGNVAADMTRVLGLSREELEVTDVADHAIDALADSAVEEIVVVGRRGPAQAAFTNPEVRELGELADCDVVVDPAEVTLDDVSRAFVESDDCTPTSRRNVEIFAGFASRAPAGKRRRIVLRFLGSPVEIKGSGRVESIVVGRNRLVRSDDGRLRAIDTGEREEIECGLVLRSIGYKGMALAGLPFDPDRGTIPNDHGRVIDPGSGEQIPGRYVVGWIKRGPGGVIGTNRKDAQDTVDALLEDVTAGRVPEPSGDASAEAVEALLTERAPGHVTFSGWQAIDRAEVARGEPHGRPRVKFSDVDAMLDVARGQTTAG
ncbi:FAD-dependent oxidoreductase [Conexibacter woesei]|uniref:ferredoxin--NADP(+) reductase n=1 Tax=Conexibacter woesei (strain DSM 14684 / CCUG 47730 / CIP 108061 / JCM 11494 / NBRC 100937 / ID131577) TaxID=469383 RepID=D3F7T1_CONWI|nr:FAD-dependent oxidoreductase [Conexibacter woesei]ADB52825.1 FAD-dependent pyridine nucleotide-disulphide oxidoreductase [Conexibacter woesei DSM 14684]